MAITVPGVVSNGVVVPESPLPEGARVEIYLQPALPAASPRLTPSELRKLPPEQQDAILAAAAALAAEDYRSDKELTGFEAFSEEELNDDESDSR
jgi:hypothetical protein